MIAKGKELAVGNWPEWVAARGAVSVFYLETSSSIIQLVTAVRGPDRTTCWQAAARARFSSDRKLTFGRALSRDPGGGTDHTKGHWARCLHQP